VSAGKHTPGPWRVMEGGGAPGVPYFAHVVAGNADKVHVASCAGRVGARGHDNPALIDARLIAAAPEMLAALRRALDAGIGADGRSSSPADQVRAAIVKATGSSW
jgi:hypothetical protein